MGLSGAVRCAVRISSLVRHKYVGDLYLFFAVRRTQYMHVCGVCMRWVRASTISNCSFDNSVEKQYQIQQKELLWRPPPQLGGSILNQVGESHINIRK